MAEERKETPEERKQRKMEEIQKKLDQVRAQHEAWEASGLGHRAFDAYAEFRQPLNEEEQETLNGFMKSEEEMRRDPPPPEMTWEKGFIDEDYRLALSPSRMGRMQIAMQRAEIQTSHVYPEEPGLMEKYPGIDPYGKFTETEMALAYRLEQVKAAMAVRPPEVRAYVKDVLDDMTKDSTAIGGVMKQMSNKGMYARQMNRAAKVAPDRETSEHLEEEAFNRVRTCQEMKWADRAVQTLESLVGLNNEPITEQQRQELAEKGREIPQAVEALRDAPNVQPAGLTVEFADFEHEKQYRFISDPHHWEKSLRDMPPDFAPGKEEAVAGIVSRYATATASRALDGCFRQIEELTCNRVTRREAPAINRGDLVTVDGMTIREHMERQYLAEHKSLAGFGPFYDKNFQQQAGEIVSAGLMAGKRVEAFVPDKQGRIPKEPMQVTKSGYEPSPLKKVTLNAWERHFAKRGFYKEKLAKAEEYRRVMESRERVKTINDKQRSDLLSSNSDFCRNQIFGGRVACDQAMAGHETQYSWTRGFPGTLAISVLMARGRSLEDIFNPDKLQAEKLAAGREVIEHTRADDHAWIGRQLHDGFTALIDKTDQLCGSFNVADPRQIQEHYPQVSGQIGLLFDLYQEVTRPGALKGFLARAEELAPGTSTQKEFEMEERIRALGSMRLGMEHIVNGKIFFSDPNRIQQAELRDQDLGSSEMGNFFAGVVTTQRFAQVMQSGVPASRALGGLEASALLMAAGMTPEVTGIMDPVEQIKDDRSRGQIYRAIQHLATHDRLNQALPTALGRRGMPLPLDSYTLKADGTVDKVPQMTEVGRYTLRADRDKFVQTLQEGAKKLESARRLEEQHRENTAEAAAKQEQKAAKQAQKTAKAKPAGMTK